MDLNSQNTIYVDEPTREEWKKFHVEDFKVFIRHAKEIMVKYAEFKPEINEFLQDKPRLKELILERLE